MSAYSLTDSLPIAPAYAPPDLPWNGGGGETLANVLRRRHERYPTKTALIDGKRNLTYADLWHRVDEQQQLLDRAGVQPADVVAICAPNSLDMSVLFLAVLSLGAVPFVVNYRIEVLGDLGQLNVVWFAVPRGSLAIRRQLAGVPYLTQQALDARFDLFRNTCGTSLPTGDTALLVTSSGSSGIAKVVQLTNSGTLFNIRANVDALKLRADDVTAIALPMGYSYGLIGQFLSHLYVGATVLLLDPLFFLHQMVWLFGRHRVTTLFLVPPMVRQLNYLYDRKLLPADFSTLRFVAVGGNRIETTAVRKAMQVFGCPVVKTYGLAEAGPRVATHPVHHPADPDLESVGRPNQGVRVQIIDETGDELPPGKIGTVRVHSPSVMMGYFNAPDCPSHRPRAAITTRDVGYIDPGGRLFVLGRKGDQFRIGERSYWFREVENVLYTHFAFLKIALRHTDGQIHISAIAMRDYPVRETDVYARLHDAFGPHCTHLFAFSLLRTNSLLNEK
ncbi:class I adenylate-forming enzyme family protein [Spirosoma agri]|uniref:Acyl--CoA ligase n=1 Tax=Spirosoma agri TaxID=1987381 RepID=A0A6M0IRZ8_9BACT|nr:class I adenylate-forming enzyme family protein [Spirosoma agri]NEU69763.1 acyl--CoA ligase [Spirosoma agri]